MISTHLLVEYVEGDEEALETSFQALEIVGRTNAEAKEGSPKPSRAAIMAAIMAARVLISNDFQPDKGLGKELEGIAKLVAFQENPGHSGLSYIRTTREGRLGRRAQNRRWIQPDLYCYFTSRGIISTDQIIVIEDQLPRLAKWSIPFSLSSKKRPKNYSINIKTSLQIDNVTLGPDNANESSRKDEGESPKEEALVELGRLLEQERSKLQSRLEELEIINLGEEEAREIQVGKQMPSNLRQRLVELLKKYVDVFAWSYRDMSGLDSTIVEHKLPLIPNTVPV
ncbi:hypothetical protein CR513_58203, partial [Mucuna pruriens]